MLIVSQIKAVNLFKGSSLTSFTHAWNDGCTCHLTQQFCYLSHTWNRATCTVKW